MRVKLFAERQDGCRWFEAVVVIKLQYRVGSWSFGALFGLARLRMVVSHHLEMPKNMNA
jgi:hypothetical protein